MTNQLQNGKDVLAEALIKKQSRRIEEELSELRNVKGGRTIQVFKLLEKIRGPKKPPQEASAIMDEKTKEVFVSPDEIKNASLKYCKDVLKKNMCNNATVELGIKYIQSK